MLYQVIYLCLICTAMSPVADAAVTVAGIRISIAAATAAGGCTVGSSTSCSPGGGSGNNVVSTSGLHLNTAPAAAAAEGSC